MHSRFRRSFSLIVATGLAALAQAGVAHASTACNVDSDCEKGFTCQATGGSGCAMDAQPVDGGSVDASPACTPSVARSCEPANCTQDADCATGFVCHASSYSGCELQGTTADGGAGTPATGAPATAPATRADAGAPASCTPSTISSCVPKYTLPCTTDDDCGDHFTCVPDLVGSCSASGGTAPSTASGANDPSVPVDAGGEVDAAPTCTTTRFSTSHCQAEPISCSSDSQCPAAWICSKPGGAACPAIALADGGSVPCQPLPLTDVTGQCTPPFYSGSSGGGAPLAASGDANGSSADAAAPLRGGPQTADAGSVGQQVGGTRAPNADVAGSDGGCQAAPGSSAASGSMWMLLLGLAGLATRRTRRARR